MTALTVLLDPARYAEDVPTERIVADRKVWRRGVARYKRILDKGQDIGALVVVKHPTKELYAVLDGHHMFWALKETGAKFVKCAIIHDYYGLTFFLTEKGYYQPTPEVTKALRVPILRWGKEMLQFLKDFKEDPLRLFEHKVEKRPCKKKDLCDDDLK